MHTAFRRRKSALEGKFNGMVEKIEPVVFLLHIQKAVNDNPDSEDTSWGHSPCLPGRGSLESGLGQDRPDIAYPYTWLGSQSAPHQWQVWTCFVSHKTQYFPISTGTRAPESSLLIMIWCCWGPIMGRIRDLSHGAPGLSGVQIVLKQEEGRLGDIQRYEAGGRPKVGLVYPQMEKARALVSQELWFIARR